MYHVYAHTRFLKKYSVSVIVKHAISLFPLLKSHERRVVSLLRVTIPQTIVIQRTLQFPPVKPGRPQKTIFDRGEPRPPVVACRAGMR